MVLNPRQFTEGYIHVYRFHEDGRELEFIHKTKVEEPPMALIPFQGRLLAGVGKVIRIYDLGLRQLLRKSQADIAPTLIVSLQTQGNRIIVGDVQQGLTYVVYKQESNKLLAFADDTVNRWTTCTAMVDYESVAGGDRFGNLWILRCPEKASAESDEPGSEIQLIHARDYLHGAPNRTSLMTHFFTQDLPTSICKTNLVVGGQDVLLWSGIQGTVGVLIPFVSREDVDFFQNLENHMRSEDPPLAGRDHLIYRGYYTPVKGVIDGDLCERFSLLPNDKKQTIAGELDRSVREIERKISVCFTSPCFPPSNDVTDLVVGYPNSICLLMADDAWERLGQANQWFGIWRMYYIIVQRGATGKAGGRRRRLYHDRAYQPGTTTRADVSQCKTQISRARPKVPNAYFAFLANHPPPPPVPLPLRRDPLSPFASGCSRSHASSAKKVSTAAAKS